MTQVIYRQLSAIRTTPWTRTMCGWVPETATMSTTVSPSCWRTGKCINYETPTSPSPSLSLSLPLAMFTTKTGLQCASCQGGNPSTGREYMCPVQATELAHALLRNFENQCSHLGRDHCLSRRQEFQSKHRNVVGSIRRASTRTDQHRGKKIMKEHFTRRPRRKGSRIEDRVREKGGEWSSDNFSLLCRSLHLKIITVTVVARVSFRSVLLVF